MRLNWRDHSNEINVLFPDKTETNFVPASCEFLFQAWNKITLCTVYVTVELKSVDTIYTAKNMQENLLNLPELPYTIGSLSFNHVNSFWGYIKF